MARGHYILSRSGAHSTRDRQVSQATQRNAGGAHAVVGRAALLQPDRGRQQSGSSQLGRRRTRLAAGASCRRPMATASRLPPARTCPARGDQQRRRLAVRRHSRSAQSVGLHLRLGTVHRSRPRPHARRRHFGAHPRAHGRSAIRSQFDRRRRRCRSRARSPIPATGTSTTQSAQSAHGRHFVPGWLDGLRFRRRRGPRHCAHVPRRPAQNQRRRPAAASTRPACPTPTTAPIPIRTCSWPATFAPTRTSS